MVKPRGWFDVFVRLAFSMGLLFGVLTSFFMAQVMNETFAHVFVRGGGALGGAFYGVTMAAIFAHRFRAITASVPVASDRDEFISLVTLRLAELGFHPSHPVAHTYTFKPSFSAGWASGALTIRVERSEATIIGPAVHVRKLLKLPAKSDSLQTNNPYRAAETRLP